jgi:hypothetical protein
MVATGMKRVGQFGMLLVFVSLAGRTLRQSAPASPDRAWHSAADQQLRQTAERMHGAEFALDAWTTYSLAESRRSG